MICSREQKLIDIMFEVLMTVTDKEQGKWFRKKSRTNEEKANWLAKQLKDCGFNTKPCGASWGVLCDK